MGSVRPYFTVGTDVAYGLVLPTQITMYMFNTLALIQDLPKPQGPDLTRYFAVLGGVAVILVLSAIGIRRLVSKGGLGLKGSRRSLEIVDVLPMGSRRQVAVVRCYDRTFALGMGEKTVSLLAELDADMVQNERNKNTTGGKKAAGAARNGLGSLLRPQYREKAQVADQLSKASDDGFERMLDRAQDQLDAKRSAGRNTQQTEARVSAGGLEELC
ncbi:MAG: flagellar biogenesis protein FliO [Planctomycetota bacterium]|jgi:flagellar biogenesis protein FliO